MPSCPLGKHTPDTCGIGLGTGTNAQNGIRSTEAGVGNTGVQCRVTSQSGHSEFMLCRATTYVQLHGPGAGVLQRVGDAVGDDLPNSQRVQDNVLGQGGGGAKVAVEVSAVRDTGRGDTHCQGQHDSNACALHAWRLNA